jgi:succinate dehydrogenase / fumarate reductase membrane anchor subunit
LLVLVGFYHAAMGLQVVLEDYVAAEGKRMVAIIMVKMALFALATLTILSILKVSL